MLRGYKPVTVRCQPGSRGRVRPLKFVSSENVFYCSASSPTCQEKQDSVVFAVGCLDPLDSQVAVGVFSRHHGEVSSNWSHTVICQEVLFDKAQGIVWGVVQATLTQKLTQTNYFCIHFHLCGTFFLHIINSRERAITNTKLLPAQKRIYCQVIRQRVVLFISSCKVYCGSHPLHRADCHVACSYIVTEQHFEMWNTAFKEFLRIHLNKDYSVNVII